MYTDNGPPSLASTYARYGCNAPPSAVRRCTPWCTPQACPVLLATPRTAGQHCQPSGCAVLLALWQVPGPLAARMPSATHDAASPLRRPTLCCWRLPHYAVVTSGKAWVSSPKTTRPPRQRMAGARRRGLTARFAGLQRAIGVFLPRRPFLGQAGVVQRPLSARGGRAWSRLLAALRAAQRRVITARGGATRSFASHNTPPRGYDPPASSDTTRAYGSRTAELQLGTLRRWGLVANAG